MEARRKVYDGLERKGYTTSEVYEQAVEGGKSLYDLMHDTIHAIHQGNKKVTVNACLKNIRTAHPPATSLRTNLPAPPPDQLCREPLFQNITLAMEDMKKRGLVMGEIMCINSCNHKELNGCCSVFLKLQVWNNDDMDDLKAFMEFFTRIDLITNFPEHAEIMKDHFDNIWCQVILGV